ncbi:hypothetical protein HYDPIDRAFT_108372, partial [Hydnomerulius pinastri MD-312]
GETGVGKSSVINLIAGMTVAEVSPDVQGCTMDSKQYDFKVGGKNYCIFDTVGLEEPEMGVNGYLEAIEKALELIQKLTRQGGVDLLLFCIRGNRCDATTQSNYRLFYEVLCGGKVPVALVITHLEREVVMEEWWTRNVGTIEKYGIKSAAHACITGVPDNRPGGKYAQSREAIRVMLGGYDGEGKYMMPPEGWFIRFMQAFGIFAPPKGLKGRKLVDVLTKRCRLDRATAQELAA